MATIIKYCSCTHIFQDNTYGKGNRVHTEGGKVASCTVCGKQKVAGTPPKKK